MDREQEPKELANVIDNDWFGESETVPCGDCDESFDSNYFLRKHRRVEHRRAYKSVKRKAKEKTCKECGEK